MDEKQKLIQAISSHTEKLNKKELEMILRFIYSLEDLK